MPEIRSKSAKNPHRSSASNRWRRNRRQPNSPESSSRIVPGRLIRSKLFNQLIAIQINTAGLSGPYRSDAETMERVSGNHGAVKEIRRLIRRSLLVPRQGQLWELLLSASLDACKGDVHQAARLLGASVRQLRSSLLEQDQPKAP